MSAHSDLVLSLTVERFTRWTATTTGTSAAEQLARAIAHEKRRPQRPLSDFRRRTHEGDTIDESEETS